MTTATKTSNSEPFEFEDEDITVKTTTGAAVFKSAKSLVASVVTMASTGIILAYYWGAHLIILNHFALSKRNLFKNQTLTCSNFYS